MMAIRIGFYICHCGINIAYRVRVEEVAEFARGLKNVVVARDYKFMCSDPGQEMIEVDIKQHYLNRVVVASCSPRLHEKTFQGACQRAGLNPYVFQMASVREQVSWVTEDEDKATSKAKTLVAAAINRVNFHERLPAREVGVHPDILVVGGGIAGMQAALDIADSGHKAYLVEREPTIGGHMLQFDKTFPTLDCAACIGTPKMVAVGQHSNIELMTYSEVAEVSGFIGNFKVKVRNKPRYVDASRCTGCGICDDKCPVKVKSEWDEGLTKRKAIYTPFPQAVPNTRVIDPKRCIYFKKKGKCKACEKFCESNAIDFNQKEEIAEIEVGSIILATGYDVMDPTPMKQFGYGAHPNVFTSLEFERLSNATGPTGGEILIRDEKGKLTKTPGSVAILHCIGSRDVNYHEYCSRVCCMYAVKYTHLIKEKVGHETPVYDFYIDMRCFGKGYEEFYRRCQEEGTMFIRGKVAEVTDQATTPEEKDKLIVIGEDTLLGMRFRLPVDMVILCVAMQARQDALDVGRIFGVNQGADGFFLEEHPKLGPLNTTTDGVFLAGACQGPKDIPDAVAQASGAAAKALSLATLGRVEIPSTISWIDPNVCAGCQTCIGLCPYTAIEFDARRGVSVVNEALCKGCGSCAGFCPSGAAQVKHFKEKQIFAEFDGIMDALSAVGM
jgi:heterodisulfide reductase subunit A